MVVITSPERSRPAAFWLSAALLATGAVQAQTGSAGPTVQERNNRQGWQACHAMSGDAAAQLACFKSWADSQLPAGAPPPGLTSAPTHPETAQPATAILLLPALATEAADGKKIGCRNTDYSELSRFWELQRGSDCDTFGLRSYRPISLAVVFSDGINSRPSSTAPRPGCRWRSPCRATRAGADWWR